MQLIICMPVRFYAMAQATYSDLYRSLLDLQPGAPKACSTAALLGAAPSSVPKPALRGAGGTVPVRSARITLQQEHAGSKLDALFDLHCLAVYNHTCRARGSPTTRMMGLFDTLDQAAVAAMVAVTMEATATSQQYWLRWSFQLNAVICFCCMAAFTRYPPVKELLAKDVEPAYA